MIHLDKERKKYCHSEVVSALRKSKMQLKSVLKKSSKKSSGIYYTPNFVVYHITKTAISQSLINRINASVNLKKRIRSLNELKKAENYNVAKLVIDEILPSFFICDIAMGWGIFLLHSFDILFDIYENLYLSLGENNFTYNLDQSNESLSIKEFIIEQIISNNLYGVDLSQESVELAKLKIIEKTLQITKKNEIILPEINFTTGNCLIGSISFDDSSLVKNNSSTFISQLLSKIPEKNKQSVKTWLIKEKLVHWNKIFPKVFRSDGFDVIIGNPPYINVKRLRIEERRFFSKIYKTYNSNGDISNIFWERSLALCKDKGIVSFITPRYWLEGCDSNSLRDFILQNSLIKEIIDFRSNRTIFQQTEDTLGIDTAIITVQKGRISQSSFDLYLSKDNSLIKKIDNKLFRRLRVKQTSLTENKWIFEKPTFISRIEDRADYLLGDDKKHKRFEGICDIGKGCSTGNNRIFRLIHLSQNIFEGANGEKLHLKNDEIQNLRLLIKNSDIKRYQWDRRNQYWIFLKNKDIDDFPNIRAYLEKYRNRLEKTKEKYGLEKYYDYVAYRSLPLIEKEMKIICPYQATNNKFAPVANKGKKTINETDVITLALKDQFLKKINSFYLLAILNSELINYYTKYMNKKIYNLYDFRSNQISHIPVLECSNQEPFDKLVWFLLNLISRRNGSHNVSLEHLISNIIELLNLIVFEIYCRENLSTNLLGLVAEKLAHLSIEEISKDKECKLIRVINFIFNDDEINDDIQSIIHLPEIKEIKMNLKPI